MPSLPKNASKDAKQACMDREMGDFKRGQMHSGSKEGRVVKKRSQGVAIAMSTCGLSRNKDRKKTRSKSRGGRR